MMMRVLLPVILLVLLCSPTGAGYTVQQLPVGVHWDVEPHALSAWDSDWQSVANQWLDLLETVTPMARSVGLVTTVDIPFWYDTRMLTRGGSTRSLMEFTLDVVDRVMLMDYRDTVSQIVSKASDELQYAYQLNEASGATPRKPHTADRRVVVGLEMGSCNDSAIQHITFCGENATRFRDVALAAQDDFALAPLGNGTLVPSLTGGGGTHPLNQTWPYDGLAIHDYAYLRHLDQINQTSLNFAFDIFGWQTEAFVYPASGQTAVFAFLDQFPQLRSIYLGCIALTRYEKGTVAAFLNTSYQHGGKRVELLFGGHSWALSNNHQDAVSLMDEVVSLMGQLRLVCTAGQGLACNQSNSLLCGNQTQDQCMCKLGYTGVLCDTWVGVEEAVYTGGTNDGVSALHGGMPGVVMLAAVLLSMFVQWRHSVQ